MIQCERGKRRPGRQPGDPGMTVNLAEDPDERIARLPASRMLRMRRHPGRGAVTRSPTLPAAGAEDHRVRGAGEAVRSVFRQVPGPRPRALQVGR